MMGKESHNWISYVKLSVLIYSIYYLNECRLSMLKDVENKLAIMHTSLEKSKELFINKFEKTEIKLIESSEKWEESFNKTKILLKKIKISQMESFQNSEKVSELILKMVESQQKAAAIQPPITIMDESVVKPIVMAILAVLCLSIVCTWWYAPKIILVTTTQIAKLNLIVSELVQYIPRSNSAKGTSFVTELGIRINTEVIRGISNHTVTETLTQKTFTLEEYLIKVMVNNPHVTQEVLPVITKAGHDISVLFY